jgi:hypothetical protein
MGSIMNKKILLRFAVGGLVGLELIFRGASSAWGGDAEGIFDVFLKDPYPRKIFFVSLGIVFLLACYYERLLAPRDRWLNIVKGGLERTLITLGLAALALVAFFLLASVVGGF